MSLVVSDEILSTMENSSSLSHLILSTPNVSTLSERLSIVLERIGSKVSVLDSGLSVQYGTNEPLEREEHVQLVQALLRRARATTSARLRKVIDAALLHVYENADVRVVLRHVLKEEVRVWAKKMIEGAGNIEPVEVLRCCKLILLEIQALMKDTDFKEGIVKEWIGLHTSLMEKFGAVAPGKIYLKNANERETIKVLTANSQLAEFYHDEVSKQPESSVEATKIIFSYAASAQPTLLVLWKAKAVDWLVKLMGTGNFVNAANIISSYAPILKSFDFASFKSTVLPVIQRLLKRCPELIAKHLGLLFSFLQFDTTPLLDALLPLLFSEFVGKNEELMMQLPKVLIFLLNNTSSQAAYALLVQLVNDAWSGKLNGSAATSIQKIQILNFLSQLVERVSRFSFVKKSSELCTSLLSSTLIPALVALMTKELKVEVRRVGFKLLALCYISSNSVPTFSHWCNLGKDKEASFLVLELFSIVAIFGKQADFVKEVVMASAAVQVPLTIATSAAARQGFFFGVSLLSFDKKNYDVIRKALEGVDTLPALQFKKADEEEILAVWILAERLLSLDLPISKSFAVFLLVSLVHSSSSVRQFTNAYLKKIGCAALSSVLIDSFGSFLDLFVLNKTLITDKLPPPSHQLRSILFAIVAFVDHAAVEVVDLLAVILHHPFLIISPHAPIFSQQILNPASLPTSSWFCSISERSAQISPPVSVGSNTLLEGIHADWSSPKILLELSRQSSLFRLAVKSKILDTSKISSPAFFFIAPSRSPSLFSLNPDWRQAVGSLLISLIEANHELAEDLIKSLLPILNQKLNYLANLSSEEIEIYYAPKGKVIEKKILEDDSSKQKKKVGKKTKEEIEQEEWEKKMEEKKKKQYALSSDKDRELKLYMDQDELRKKICAVIWDVETILSVLGRLVAIFANGDLSFVFRSGMFDLVTKLCPISLLQTQVQDFLTHFAVIFDCAIKKGSNNVSLARCLFGCVLLKNDFFLSESRVILLQHILCVVENSIASQLDEEYSSDSVYQGSYLAAAPFKLLWPILLIVSNYAVANKNAKVAGFHSSLQIIHAHASSARKFPEAACYFYPISEMLYLLLRFLDQLPSTRTIAEASLLGLALVLRVQDIDTLDFVGPIGLLSESIHTREILLKLLLNMREITSHTVKSVSGLKLQCILKLLCQGDNEAGSELETVANLAKLLVDQFQIHLEESHIPTLMEYISSHQEKVRTVAALAFASAVEEKFIPVDAFLEVVFKLYLDSPDSLVESEFRRDPVHVSRYHIRLGVASCISALNRVCATAFASKESLISVLNFLTRHALGDMHDEVWEAMLNAGLEIVDRHGEIFASFLIPLLESSLEQKDSGDSQDVADKKYEGCVILIGRAARFLIQTDRPKVEKLLKVLLDVLMLPSHAVQMAVSSCLKYLISGISEVNQGLIIQQLLKQLCTSLKYGERKGASYGLAGVLAGLKFYTLKKYNVISTLLEMVQDKTNTLKRQGALFAFESLFLFLGSKFEPYVHLILPHLLLSFSDSDVDVIAATEDACRAMMANLTEHGIRIVLPVVMKSLRDAVQWRPKVEAIGLLGSMAFCAPKQLSSCLPLLVPVLLEKIGDPHVKVTACSKNALEGIGKVIQNPEIQLIVAVLMPALTDSINITFLTKALQTLMETSFVHSVDAASLALIMPIIRRGLRARTTVLKKMSCQICGSISSLISSVKDILPYSKDLLIDFKSLIVDPIPEVRSHAAKAMGQLFKGLGEEHFEGIIPWLMNLLKNETTSVERSGYAQALSEILAVSGEDKLDDLLGEIVAQCKSPKTYVRESHLSLFVFLPKAFGDSFGKHIGLSFPLVLAGLADDTEIVRDVALKAGQVLVYMFARIHTDLLLPRLESGIFDLNWRIRDNCTRLLGDLLHRLAGAKSVISFNDDEGEDLVANADTRSLIEGVIGKDKLDRILASLYVARYDATHLVKDTAWRVWKSIIANTPRVLREMLPSLMDQIVESLATSNAERQAAAGRALGELVSKMAEIVLPVIVPYITKSLESPDAHARQGVAMGLAELLRSASKSLLSVYMTSLYPSIQRALCDEDVEVREAASYAFSVLFDNLGKRAIIEILPVMLDELFKKAADGNIDEEFEYEELSGDEDSSGGEDDEESTPEDDGTKSNQEEDDPRVETKEFGERNPSRTFIVEGIRHILDIAPDVVIPILIPRLIQPKITSVTARILASLADAVGEDVVSFLPDILRGFVRALAIAEEVDYEEILDAAQLFVIEGINMNGLNKFVTTMIELLDASGPLAIVSEGKQAAACSKIIQYFVANTDEQILDSVGFFLSSLIKLLVAEYEVTQNAALDAIEALIEVIPKDNLPSFIPSTRSWIKQAITDSNTGLPFLETIPAFSLTKSFSPFWPMLQQGLLYGTPDARSQAARALGELINLTSSNALKSLAAKVTGPLIRIVGDRFPPVVKTSILKTLGLLIDKAGKYLKPFLSPMQTAFIKTLYDPASD